jgi:hypothetical protein
MPEFQTQCLLAFLCLFNPGLSCCGVLLARELLGIGDDLGGVLEVEKPGKHLLIVLGLTFSDLGCSEPFGINQNDNPSGGFIAGVFEV